MSGLEHHGYVFIADITGYTAYLNESELEHAKGTLTDLLELLVDKTRHPFHLSALEGDAVFSYTLDVGFVSAQTFLETVEATYVDFRRAIELMVLNNTCQCNACANVANLDLKFFVHYGEFVVQEVGTMEQAVGAAVNLAHRLLKNSVKADTGLEAYLLLTDAAVESLGLVKEGLIRHSEQVGDFGDVDVWLIDMHPIYELRPDTELEAYTPDEILVEASTEVPLPIELVWEYANQSELRNLIIGSDRYEILDAKRGRVDVGSTYQCYHGRMAVRQTVLEWRPFDRVLLRQVVPVPGKPVTTLVDIRFMEVDGGTRVDHIGAKLMGPRFKRLLIRRMLMTQAKKVQRNLDLFRERVSADKDYPASDNDAANRPTIEQISAQAADSLADFRSKGD